MEKEEESLEKEQSKTITCDYCGRPVPADTIWWEEESGLMCCMDCRAEKESCGCSD